MGQKSVGAANKRAGSKWERDIVHLIKKYFKLDEVYTSRAESRALDARKVDIVDPTDLIHQCKVNSKKSINVVSILKDMVEYRKEGEIPIVDIRQREKKGSRFYTQAEVSVMYTEDLFKLLGELHELRAERQT